PPGFAGRVHFPFRNDSRTAVVLPRVSAECFRVDDHLVPTPQPAIVQAKYWPTTKHGYQHAAVVVERRVAGGTNRLVRQKSFSELAQSRFRRAIQLACPRLPS